MKKNEYVAPEMEIVEITEQCNIMAISNDRPGQNGKDDTIDDPNFGGYGD